METKHFSRKLVHIVVFSALCLGLMLTMGSVQASSPRPNRAPSISRETDTVNVIVVLKSQPLEEAAQEVKANYRTELEGLRSQIQAAAASPTAGRAYATVEEERDVVHSAPPLTTAQKNEQATLSAQMEARMRDMRQEMASQARPAVEASQEDIVRTIESLGGTVHSRLFILNGVAAAVPGDAIDALRSHPDVAEVLENETITSTLNVSTGAINASTWWSNGYNGGIWDIGIIDSGVDDTHPALSGHAFTERRCLAAAGDPSGDPTGDDVNGHGTHVAGITSSTDGTYQGVAFGSNVLINGKAAFDPDGLDGGVASMYWSDGMECVDWPGDDCDPGAGGADCIGMCVDAGSPEP